MGKAHIESAQLVSPDNPDGFGLLSLDLKKHPQVPFLLMLSTSDSSVVIDKTEM